MAVVFSTMCSILRPSALCIFSISFTIHLNHVLFHSPVFSCHDVFSQQHTLYCTISPLLKTSDFVRAVRPFYRFRYALYDFNVSSLTVARFSARFVTQPLPSSASRLLTYVFYVCVLSPNGDANPFQEICGVKKLVYHPPHATRDPTSCYITVLAVRHRRDRRSTL